MGPDIVGASRLYLRRCGAEDAAQERKQLGGRVLAAGLFERNETVLQKEVEKRVLRAKRKSGKGTLCIRVGSSCRHCFGLLSAQQGTL